MDEDTRELVQRLCTQAGMMMEDASLLAVTITARDEERAGTTLRRLTTDAACIEALLTAAARLVEQRS
jgi:hypothetical protein